MNHITIIGICASTFTSLSLLPQLIKLAREKKSKDLSVGMLSVLATGLAFWIYYGILKDDTIIIIANGIALMITVTTGILAIFYKKR